MAMTLRSGGCISVLEEGTAFIFKVEQASKVGNITGYIEVRGRKLSWMKGVFGSLLDGGDLSRLRDGV
jgi:hypothetical protein